MDYVDSKLDARCVGVLDIDTTYSPKFTAYCVKNGKTCEMKIHSRLNSKNKSIKVSYANIPVVNGDMIYMNQCEKTAKKRKVNDEWQIVPNECVWWITDYKKII